MKQNASAATPASTDAEVYRSGRLYTTRALTIPASQLRDIVLYPGECYYCGACVMACPHDGAIRLEHPLMNRAKFVPVRYPEEK